MHETCLYNACGGLADAVYHGFYFCEAHYGAVVANPTLAEALAPAYVCTCKVCHAPGGEPEMHEKECVALGCQEKVHDGPTHGLMLCTKHMKQSLTAMMPLSDLAEWMGYPSLDEAVENGLPPDQNCECGGCHDEGYDKGVLTKLVLEGLPPGYTLDVDHEIGLATGQVVLLKNGLALEVKDGGQLSASYTIVTPAYDGMHIDPPDFINGPPIGLVHKIAPSGQAAPLPAIKSHTHLTGGVAARCANPECPVGS